MIWKLPLKKYSLLLIQKRIKSNLLEHMNVNIVHKDWDINYVKKS
ncbi:hypothetical protein X975_12436, partial [Stegodyphus mimosarum]